MHACCRERVKNARDRNAMGASSSYELSTLMMTETAAVRACFPTRRSSPGMTHAPRSEMDTRSRDALHPCVHPTTSTDLVLDPYRSMSPDVRTFSDVTFFRLLTIRGIVDVICGLSSAARQTCSSDTLRASLFTKPIN